MIVVKGIAYLAIVLLAMKGIRIPTWEEPVTEISVGQTQILDFN